MFICVCAHTCVFCNFNCQDEIKHNKYYKEESFQDSYDMLNDFLNVLTTTFGYR